MIPSIRQRIFQIIETAKDDDKTSRIYDLTMIAVIAGSLVPLAFKTETGVLLALDRITVAFFILDYVLRLCTADLKLRRGWLSFILYPFTPMAIIDLLCILPSFSILAPGFRLLKCFRLFRAFRVFRAAKMLRYSKSITVICDVIRKQKAPLLAVCTLAVGYVLLSALVIFNVEPDTFGSFFDAFYWAVVSLTTVGYGDIYPVTTLGRIITMLSSVIGIAIVALPSGIITAGYMDEIRKTEHRSETEEV